MYPKETENTEKSQEPVILIAEDNYTYYHLVLKHLQRIGISNKVIRFQDGQEVLDFLQNQSKLDRDLSADYLLTLDIRMPKLDGLEVLKILKKSQNYKDIPVVIHSSTSNPETIETCYTLGCIDYVVKTGSADNILQIFKHTKLSLTAV